MSSYCLDTSAYSNFRRGNEKLEELMDRAELVGVPTVALGEYDFVTVIEAPDERTMAKISVELGSRGTMTSRTLTAMPAEDLTV